MPRTALYGILCLLGCLAIWAGTGEPFQESLFEDVYEAWDRGDYISALQGFKAVLEGPDGAPYFERIALLTGELFDVQEVAEDGRNVQFSPDGRYAAYETETGRSQLIHLVEIGERLIPLAEIKGRNGVFLATGDALVFLRPVETPEIASLRKEMDKENARTPRDARAVFTLQRRIEALEAKWSEIVLWDIASAREVVLPDGGLLKGDLASSSDGRDVYFVGAEASGTEANEIYAVPVDRSAVEKPRPLTSGPGFKVSPLVVPGGNYLVYSTTSRSPFPALPPSETPPSGQAARPAQKPDQAQRPASVSPMRGRSASPREFVVVSLADGKTRTFEGTSPAVSADGSALVFIGREDGENTLNLLRLAGDLEPSVIKRTPEALSSASLSPDGSQIAFAMTYTRNLEVFLIGADGKGEVRLTREIQHDRSPFFLSENKVIAIKGERRHSRAYLYDTQSLSSLRLFHNNTLRTIAPEYEWAPDPTGRRLLVVADRDGDTMSPEQGVYILDLEKKISSDDLLDRIARNLAAERALRAKGEALFRPIAEDVQNITSRMSATRLYEYQEKLFSFDSKHVTQPGNLKAGEYIFQILESFGYAPEYQWVPDRPNKTANVIAVLRGSENPDLYYVMSSHYDSNVRSPGADDNSSATAVLLETCRLLAGKPLASSVIFAAFTGEESGFWGSREFVRRAQEDKLRVLGAVNNDMIGWTNDHHLDDTIRYSNAGIRDVLHASAFGFSRMVTYDTRYIRSTDSVPLYEAWGDVVGGLGSYPVLGNPYYHQPTDLLETVNQQLITEAAKYNTAAIMILASSPSPVRKLRVVDSGRDFASLAWAPNPEKGITHYHVSYGPEGRAAAESRQVKRPEIRLDRRGMRPGEKLVVTVKAVNARGLVSWDEARLVIDLDS